MYALTDYRQPFSAEQIFIKFHISIAICRFLHACTVSNLICYVGRVGNESLDLGASSSCLRKCIFIRS